MTATPASEPTTTTQPPAGPDASVNDDQPVSAEAVGTKPLVARPNVILINLDDADWDLFTDSHLEAYFPNIDQHFGDGGLRFTNLHVADPLCGPSRASLFRGQYPHNTGVVENPNGWQIFYDQGYTDSEIGMWMRQAGYRTGLVGKYCHQEYPAAAHDNTYVPPGWDTFHASLGGNYYEVSRNIDGELVLGSTVPGRYRTDLELESAVGFLAEPGDDPFFLYLAPFAPHLTRHDGGMAAARHRDLVPTEVVDRAPDFNEPDMSDKSPQFAAVPEANSSLQYVWDSLWRDRLRAMMAVDEAVGRLFAELEAASLTSSTYVILTSDNGYQLGHHRQLHKRTHFDRDTRVPFFITGPGIAAGSANHLLSHIDIVPTVLELAQAPLPRFLDGRSFAPLLTDPASVAEPAWQSSVLVQNVEPKVMNGLEFDTNYRLLRRYADSYVEYENGDREYYDLAADPYQLSNTYELLDSDAVAELEFELDRLATCAGAACQDGSAAALTGPVGEIDTSLDSPVRATTEQATVSGTASDDVGVDRVEVVVRNVATRRYWDAVSSTWSADYVANPASLTDPGSPTTEWALVADLLDGEHWVSARAIDNDGNQDPTIPTSFFTAPSGLTPLRAAIESPVADAVVIGPEISLRGSADSGAGVDRVEVVVQDLTAGTWWDGTDWRDTYARAVAFDGAGSTSINWELAVPAPATVGGFFASVWAWDDEGRWATPTTGGQYIWFHAGQSGSADVEAPTVRFVSPKTGSAVSGSAVGGSAVTLIGWADDNVEVRQLSLVITDPQTRRWWDGEGWRSSFAAVEVDVERVAPGSVRWRYRLVLPPGRQGWISVSARAVDGSGSYNQPTWIRLLVGQR